MASIYKGVMGLQGVMIFIENEKKYTLTLDLRIGTHTFENTIPYFCSKYCQLNNDTSLFLTM